METEMSAAAAAVAFPLPSPSSSTICKHNAFLIYVSALETYCEFVREKSQMTEKGEP